MPFPDGQGRTGAVWAWKPNQNLPCCFCSGMQLMPKKCQKWLFNQSHAGLTGPCALVCSLWQVSDQFSILTSGSGILFHSTKGEIFMSVHHLFPESATSLERRPLLGIALSGMLAFLVALCSFSGSWNNWESYFFHGCWGSILDRIWDEELRDFTWIPTVSAVVGVSTQPGCEKQRLSFCLCLLEVWTDALCFPE